MKRLSVLLAGSMLSLASVAATPAGTAVAPATLYGTAAGIQNACDRALKAAGQQVQVMAGLSEDGNPSYLHANNQLDALLEDIAGSVGLLTYVHPDKTVRDAGEACTLRLSQFQTGLYQNEALYEQLEAVEPEDEIDEQLQHDLLDAFRDTGVALPAEPRNRVKAILDQLQALDQEFDRNLRENKTTLHFSREELRGLPASYLKAHKTDRQGGITVGFDYPDYVPFITYADDAKARERYYRAFQNRGTTRNLDILDQIVSLRKELATLHDLDSYADLVTRRNMVGDPGTVLDFLDEVRDVIDEVESRDIAALVALKSAQLKVAIADTRIAPWDKEYYLERLRQSRHQIDQNVLRNYFPTQAAVAWALDISAELYGLRFTPRKVSVWHPDVRYFETSDARTGQVIGGIYLDLYPRPGKYGHAAAFPVRGSSSLLGRKPLSVLVTNLDRRGLTPDELEVLLHEFGHVLHGVLSNTRYVAQAGTSVDRDFVEAPSQMYEEWARSPQTLARMRDYCKTCPVVDESLAQRLEASRRLGSGLFYGRQHLYASYDMALAGKKPGKALPVWVDMEGATPLGHVQDTAFPGTFAHIAGGYAAGYYGYMWALAIALDLRSVFGHQLMNPEIGRRFRDTVLARGGEEPALDLVESFLGREPEPDAFFAEVRGKGRDAD